MEIKYENLINDIKKYMLDSKEKREKTGKSTSFILERMVDFSDIESLGLTEQETTFVLALLSKVKESIFSNLEDSLDIDDFEDDKEYETYVQKFAKEDFLNLASVYLLMLKKDKVQTFSIPAYLVPDILNSAMRGVRYSGFPKIMDMLTTDTMRDLMINNSFKQADNKPIKMNKILLALSNHVDTEEYNYDPNLIPQYLGEFLKDRIDPLNFEKLQNEGILNIDFNNQKIN